VVECGVASWVFDPSKAESEVNNPLGANANEIPCVLAQLIASPLAFGSVYFEPTAAMASLACSYIFAEMWFGILFAILVEIVPLAVR